MIFIDKLDFFNHEKLKYNGLSSNFMILYKLKMTEYYLILSLRIKSLHPVIYIFKISAVFTSRIVWSSKSSSVAEPRDLWCHTLWYKLFSLPRKERLISHDCYKIYEDIWRNLNFRKAEKIFRKLGHLNIFLPLSRAIRCRSIWIGVKVIPAEFSFRTTVFA